jgi:hypothetical protein
MCPPVKMTQRASTLIKGLLGENTSKVTRHEVSSNVLAPQQKIKALYDQQNTIIQSYIETHLDLADAPWYVSNLTPHNDLKK